MADESTRGQVEILAKEGKTAKEIADALGKTPATIYNHLRNLGIAPEGKRGRPRKNPDEAPAEAPAAPRARPGAAKADEPAKANVFAAKATKNGSTGSADICKVIEASIKEHEAALTKLKKMLELAS